MNLNIRAAKIMIDQLVKLGADYFCVSPGSRSTPLALAIAEHNQARAMVHFDERGTAFHALGYAKATQKPAVVVTTSGTAVGNLLPAIMEASKTHTPLIILTADRPPELQNCGSNQTIDQVKIFSDFVGFEVNLPCPDPLINDNYLKGSLAQAVFHARQGPVHINCMFREPLSGPTSYLPAHDVVSYGNLEMHPSQDSLESWAQELGSAKQGVIIVGALPSGSQFDSLHALAERLGWPIFPDIISGMRSEGVKGNVIAYYDLILKTWKDRKVEAVLHLGDQFVSKALLEWVAQCNPRLYFSVSDHLGRQDPKHIVTHRLACKPSLFCEKILPLVSEGADCTEGWKEASLQIEECLKDKFSSLSQVTEPLIGFHLSDFEDRPIFLANSMPIRDADFFYFPKEKRGPIFANRGVSGIDGNIATAIGLAQGGKKQTVAVLGDLASLHDLNSLAMLKNAEYPVIFVIINNAGGAIFSFLPLAINKETFEQFFATEHTWSFEKAAALFEIPYHSPVTMKDCTRVFQDCLQKNESCMIEIFTNRDENHLLHQDILCSLSQFLVH